MTNLATNKLRGQMALASLKGVNNKGCATEIQVMRILECEVYVLNKDPCKVG